MNKQPANRFSNQPLGTSGDLRLRFLRHHVPLALVSAVVLALFMCLPLFNVRAYPHADIVSGTFPQERREGAATGHAGGQTGRTDHDGNQNGLMRHAGDQAERLSGTQTGPTGHGRNQTEAVAGSGDHAAPIGHSGQGRRAVRRPSEAGTMGTGPGDHGGGDTGPPEDPADLSLTRGMRVTIGDSQIVLAREMRKGNDTWMLRDAAGQPLWSSGATETRGFWTTKKVLLTVVVVKVVLLATVLRH